MARSVTFNGITRYRPGAIIRINNDGTNQIGTSSSGVLALIGEADGGAPGSETGLVSINDASRAKDIFKSGPLVEAAKLAFNSSADLNIPGGATTVLLYKTNASTKSKATLPTLGVPVVSTTATTGSTTTSVNVAASLVGDLSGRWAMITLAGLPGSPTFLRRIVSNTSSVIVLASALPVAPANTNTVLVLANTVLLESLDYGLHTASVQVNLDYDPSTGRYQVITEMDGVTQTSPYLGGKNYLHVVYRGGSTAASTTVVSGSTTSVINVTPASLTNVAHVNQTMVLRDSSGNLKAISKISTNGTGSITLATHLSAVPAVGDLIEIKAVTVATAGFVGSNGAATAFQSTITGVSGDNLSIPLTAGMSLRNLAAAINSNTNYLATIPATVNQDTILANSFDYGAGTSVSIQTSYTGTMATTGYRRNVSDIIRWVDESSLYFKAVRATELVEDGAGFAALDYPGSTGDPTPWFFSFSGGTRGISANSDFQAGLDLCLLDTVDELIPLIDQDMVNEGFGSTATWAAVAAQLASHVQEARGPGNKFRGAWMGRRGDKSTILAAANMLNDPDIALTGQYPTVADVSGNLTQLSAREMAVMGASMRLGASEVGEPLTHKYLRVASVAQDPSWHPADATDSTDMIRGGVLFSESISGKGTRWVRDLTSWVRDDNLSLSEGSVRDVVRFVAQSVLDLVEDRFTGRKATPAIVASIRDAVVTLLEVHRTNNVIVDSTDPVTGGTIRAYYGLKVTSSGDIVTLAFGFFPVPGINFELGDLSVSLASQVA